jgi:hypothetical protein
MLLLTVGLELGLEEWPMRSDGMVAVMVSSLCDVQSIWTTLLRQNLPVRRRNEWL